MERYILIVMVGLPRSGKTTWARTYSEKHGIPIVNPDAIRMALHGQRFVAMAEPFVWAIAKCMVRSLFLAGHQYVIVDATNMTIKRRDEWKSSDWFTTFKPIEVDAETCRIRARNAGDLDIIPVIDKMNAEAEPLGDKEDRHVDLLTCAK